MKLRYYLISLVLFLGFVITIFNMFNKPPIAARNNESSIENIRKQQLKNNKVEDDKTKEMEKVGKEILAKLKAEYNLEIVKPSLPAYRKKMAYRKKIEVKISIQSIPNYINKEFIIFTVEIN